MKILCIGEALIDMICTDKGSSLTQGQHFLKKPGGAPTNVAAAVAALGAEVELAAKVGNDPFGKQLIQVMKEFGVSTKYMLEDENNFTSFAFVSLMEDGALSEEEVNAIDLTDISIIHFGSATAFLPGPLQKAYISLLERAKQQKIFISFDPNYRQLLFQNNTETFILQSWYFLKSCHYFKLSDEEAMLITRTATLQDAITVLNNETSAVYTITLGKDGTLLGYHQANSTIPSIPIKPVDTTGAGDAFVGAVLYQLCNKNRDAILKTSKSDWELIVKNANKAGARTCEYMGAMEAFKHLNNQIFL